MTRPAQAAPEIPGKPEGSEESVAAAARRILAEQFRIARERRAAVLAGDDPEAVHDVRVAWNRARAALRLFRPCLGRTRASKLDRWLRKLRAGMGPARDAEAWLSFLESPRVRRRLGTERGWTELVARQRARVARLYAGMRRRLRSGDWLEAERRAERLLGERIPPISDCSVSFGAFAARRIRKGYRRLLRLEPSSRGITPEELHAVRKQCKRVRYWAEFAAPALGRSVGELAVRLRAVTGALGGVHDMDVHLGVRGAAEGGMPAGLRGVMRKRRARSLAAFRRAWRAVTGGRFRARVLSGMRKAQA